MNSQIKVMFSLRKFWFLLKLIQKSDLLRRFNGGLLSHPYKIIKTYFFSFISIKNNCNNF